MMELRRAACAIAVAGCALAGVPSAASEGFIDRFAARPGEPDWRLSDYAHDGRWLDTRWSRSRIALQEPGRLAISLAPDPTSEKSFVSGEARRARLTSFGRYETVLQAARGEGLNTAFFTYTGPHRGEPHDEIDFEFLGRDTTKVWLNYYVDGEARLGVLVDLGFDAAAGPHHYAFEWTETAIRWYAEGRLLYEATDPAAPPPMTPAQIYLSLWASGPSLSEWMGAPHPETEAAAIFSCVSFSPSLTGGPSCVDAPP